MGYKYNITFNLKRKLGNSQKYFWQEYSFMNYYSHLTPITRFLQSKISKEEFTNTYEYGIEITKENVIELIEKLQKAIEIWQQVPINKVLNESVSFRNLYLDNEDHLKIYKQIGNLFHFHDFDYEYKGLADENDKDYEYFLEFFERLLENIKHAETSNDEYCIIYSVD